MIVDDVTVDVDYALTALSQEPLLNPIFGSTATHASLLGYSLGFQRFH